MFRCGCDLKNSALLTRAASGRRGINFRDFCLIIELIDESLLVIKILLTKLTHVRDGGMAKVVIFLSGMR